MTNPTEFSNIAAAKETHWWYRGIRRILFGILDRHAARARPGTIVEAGCGPGYTAALLERRYDWRPKGDFGENVPRASTTHI